MKLLNGFLLSLLVATSAFAITHTVKKNINPRRIAKVYVQSISFQDSSRSNLVVRVKASKPLGKLYYITLFTAETARGPWAKVRAKGSYQLLSQSSTAEVIAFPNQKQYIKIELKDRPLGELYYKTIRKTRDIR